MVILRHQQNRGAGPILGDANIEEPLQSIKALEAGSRKGHDENSPEVERALSGVDESKRRTLIRLLRGAAFAAPIVLYPFDGRINNLRSSGPQQRSPRQPGVMHPKQRPQKHKKKHKKKHKHDQRRRLRRHACYAPQQHVIAALRDAQNAGLGDSHCAGRMGFHRWLSRLARQYVSTKWFSVTADPRRYGSKGSPLSD